jgi:hypothetical protein
MRQEDMKTIEQPYKRDNRLPFEFYNFNGKIGFLNIENHYGDLITEERVKVIIIPDIESINYGRGVGYDIVEHVPPQDIHDISATKRREQMKQNETRD